jgi:head-tail adaptor
MNASDLARMRAELVERLTATATLYRRAATATVTGARASSHASIGPLPCKLAPQGGEERESAGRVSNVSRATLTAAFDADVRTTDRIALEGGTWEVVDVERRDSALCVRLHCVKVS